VGNFSSAQAINDAAQIVGQAETNHSTADAFFRKNGIKKDLGSLGGTSSQANAINFNPLTKTFTQIAAWSLTSDNSAYHAVTWDPSFNILDLGTLGGTSGSAFGNKLQGTGSRYRRQVGRQLRCVPVGLDDWDARLGHAGRQHGRS
jgi:probable HAF family extracellular repeat protein